MTGNLLWLDDLRPAPTGWTWVMSVHEAIRALQAGQVVHASLDHDLGDYAADGGDGTRLTDWMAEHSTWPSAGVRVHSANIPAAQVMLRTIDRYGPWATSYSAARGAAPAGGWPAVSRLRAAAAACDF